MNVRAPGPDTRTFYSIGNLQRAVEPFGVPSPVGPS